MENIEKIFKNSFKKVINNLSEKNEKKLEYLDIKQLIYINIDKYDFITKFNIANSQNNQFKNELYELNENVIPEIKKENQMYRQRVIELENQLNSLKINNSNLIHEHNKLKEVNEELQSKVKSMVDNEYNLQNMIYFLQNELVK